MSVPRKFFALQYSLDLQMYCKEKGPTESMGARQRKSKLPPSTCVVHMATLDRGGRYEDGEEKEQQFTSQEKDQAQRRDADF